MRARTVRVAATLCAAAAGCAPRAFDRHWEAGRFAQAAAEVAADSSLLDSGETLFRTALLHALPDSPVRDDEAAGALLGRYLEGHPDATRRREARALLTWLEASARLRSDVQELRRELAVDSVRLAARDSLYRAALDHLTEPGRDERRARTLLSRYLAEHPDSPRRREAEILLVNLEASRDLRILVARLRSELEQLKAIDLGRTPADSAP